MAKTFTQSDVASHNKANSLWVVIDGDVYDLTKFQEEHPGTCRAWKPVGSVSPKSLCVC